MISMISRAALHLEVHAAGPALLLGRLGGGSGEFEARYSNGEIVFERVHDLLGKHRAQYQYR
jgi:hypothetical protein